MTNKTHENTIQKYRKFEKRKPTRLYRLWASMLQRCSSAQYKERRPSYKNCKMSDEFLSFDAFAEWAVKQKNFNMHGWQLDKDLYSVGDPVYSPETCVFLPARVNSLLVKGGVKSSGLPPGIRKYKSGNYGVYCEYLGENKTFGCFENLEDALRLRLKIKQQFLDDATNPYRQHLDSETLNRISSWFVK